MKLVWWSVIVLGFVATSQSNPSVKLWTRWNEGMLEQLDKANMDLSSTWSHVFRLMKGTSFPTAVATNISQQCIEDSQTYVRHLLKWKPSPWALQMHESTANGPPVGTFKNLVSLYANGLFDECLAVRGPNSTFRGQYCNVFFRPTPIQNGAFFNNKDTSERDMNWITVPELLDWLGFQSDEKMEPQMAEANSRDVQSPGMGFCIPASCSAIDLRQSVAQLVGKYAVSNISIVTATGEHYCFTDEPNRPRFDGSDIVVMIILGTIGVLVVLATLQESVRIWNHRPIDQENDGLTVRILHCFSALNNGRKVLSTKVFADNFGCIHGIRVLSTTWVLLGHLFQSAALPGPNQFLFQSDALKWWFQAIGNFTLSVDTFFLLSGILVCCSLLRELDRNKGRFNIPLFYIHRYLRLTPVYAIILAFISTLLVHVASGPNWTFIVPVAERCRESWWKNLLYINNFNQQPKCMGQTWYLACEFQMYLISPLLIYPLWRWKKSGAVWVIFVIIASLAATVAIYIIEDLPPTDVYTRPKIAAYNKLYYNAPWYRVSPYLVGIILGYILHTTKKTRLVIPKTLVALGWAAAIATGLAVMYGLVGLLDPVKVPTINSPTRVLYGAFHRCAWAIAVGWVVFACIHGYGGFVNRFLSWKAFIPLGRLCFVVYLNHGIVLFVGMFRARGAFFYTLTDEVLYFLSATTACFAMAYPICVAVESSFLNLEKLLFSLGTSKGGPIANVRHPQVVEAHPMEMEKDDAHCRLQN